MHSGRASRASGVARQEQSIDFDTGKLNEIGRHLRPSVRREYLLLALILLVTSIPYLIAFALRPLATFCVVMFMAYIQVLMAFATSTSTDTAHAIRFLLSGSNPIGMTGASSLIFGAVDSVLDWREDSGERRRSPLKFWALLIHKLAMTPVGIVLMIAEFLWDAVAMRRPGVIRHKWNELFSLARYHDLICPEKSNDIFYADFATARHKDDATLYQWNRLRSMVFELQHYKIDAENHVGSAETNLFLQDEVTAYQTLKRLRLEEIERAVGEYYDSNLHEFPFPENVAKRLVANARPVGHYLRIRNELLTSRTPVTEFDSALSELLGERSAGSYRVWTLLRMLDDDADSTYLSANELSGWVEDGILQSHDGDELLIRDDFRDKLEALIAEHCEQASTEQVTAASLARCPNFFLYRGVAYLV